MADAQTIDTSSFPKEAQEIIKSLQETAQKSEHERNEYRKLYELVLLELERLRRQLFGKKSERVADEQLTLQFLEVAEKLKALEQEEKPAPVPNSTRKQGKGKKKKASPHGRQTLPEHLPLERIELPTPLEVEANPDDYKKMGEDVSETLERRPATLIRVQVVRPKYAKKGDDATILFSGDGTVTMMGNGEEIVSVKNELLGKALLAIYLGEKPIDKNIKKNLVLLY